MVRQTQIHKWSLLFVALLSSAGCKNSTSSQEDTNPAPNPPLVDDLREDLVLTYDTPEGPRIAGRVADVPQEARGSVRVQDPQTPPEARDPSWVFVADLSAKAENGTYPVQVIHRNDYEKQRLALRPKVDVPEPAQGASSAPALRPTGPSVALPPGTRVIMYATKHCPVCVKARRWLLDQGIPYIERDLEEDAAAAAELQAKAGAQGVPASGVPMFEVDGKIVPGFDPGVLLKLWRAKVDA
jgi:glutaredoxin